MTKILVTDGIDAEGLSPLTQNKNFELVVTEDAAQVEKEIVTAEALLVRSKTKVNPDLISRGKNLKYIGRAGVGVDNIDIPSATQRGIIVANVPDGNTISAAEHTFALLLSLARNVPAAHASMKAGEWKRNKFMGSELLGKTLGLVGFGRIGKEVGKRALAFGMKVVAHDPFVNADHVKSFGMEACSFDELLAQSDFISLHMPVTDITRGMINREVINKMKQDARLINCARGELIDEAAFIEAMRSGRIKGAALDVFAPEPPKNKDLLALDNVIFTPHLGASTEEAQVKVAKELSLALKDYFEQGIVRNAVNLPALDPELLEKYSAYVDLAEKLGKLAAQMTPGGVQKVEIIFGGEFAAPARHFLMLSVLKGVLSHALHSDGVNWVNALPLSRERGIQVEDRLVVDPENFTSLLTVRMKTDKSERSVSGTVFSSRRARIVEIDAISVDILPQGHMILFNNTDRPGVIGFVGTLLGENNINIAEFQVGRNRAGSDAVSIICIDQPAPQIVIDKIRAFTGISNVCIAEI